MIRKDINEEFSGDRYFCPLIVISVGVSLSKLSGIPQLSEANYTPEALNGIDVYSRQSTCKTFAVVR